MKNLFNTVQYPKVGSNSFDLSHDVKLSFNMGQLVPTLVMDCVPGDRIRLSTETMLRFAPLISPVMHRVNVTTHYFFVPNRILWPNWDRWITGDLDVEPPTVRTPVSTGGYPVGSLADYMGIPAGQEFPTGSQINALPFAAYMKIWYEYYRDQNLMDLPSTLYELVDGQQPISPDTWNAVLQGFPLLRSWMHDYFTSALPFAQKGDAVQIPLGTFDDTPVVSSQTPTNPGAWRNPADGTLRMSGQVESNGGTVQVTGQGNAFYDPVGSLVAQTSQLQAAAADINSLRRAFRLQEWLEKNARGGTRYIENIMAHFGVKSSDARLQRPEFLGSSFQRMVISEVLSTAETDVPVGQMAGHGISVGAGKEFSYYCEEHGWIIGILNVQPVTAYQQGLQRMFHRPTRLDYYWPSFAHIGEQEVLNQEVFVTDDAEHNAETFGYVPRYAEYKYLNSRVCGEMRTTLSHWHLGRIFETAPALSQEFIQSFPITRIFAVQDDHYDHIYGHVFNNVKAVRKMPKYGTPTF